MVIVAIVLGAGLIAGEVNKGTIFFLLGKPISRERVLLIKYAVSALILLAISAITSIALIVTAAVMGHPQDIGGVMISALLVVDRSAYLGWVWHLCSRSYLRTHYGH